MKEKKNRILPAQELESPALHGDAELVRRVRDYSCSSGQGKTFYL